MYIPASYKNENLSEVKAFITQNSFAILVNQVDGKPWATHIPLELDLDDQGRDILVGHLARANPQWKFFEKNPEVLCIFNGPHSYVSSSWYRDEEVPTWNYIAVHIYGKIRILEEQEVLNGLHKLVDKYEQDMERPISIDQLSPKTMRQIRGIVGFEIRIEKIQAAYKLSQGREQDHGEIIRHLEKGTPSSKAIAQIMKHRLK